MDILNALLQLAFFIVFAAALVRYLRRPGAVELAVVAVFSTTAAIFMISILNTFAPGLSQTLQPVAITLLLSQPLLILVLIRLIMPLARWALPLALAAFIAATAALLIPPERIPAALLFVGGYFIVVEGAAAVLLVRESQRRFGTARIRLALAGLATAAFGMAILVASVGAAAAGGEVTDPLVLLVARVAALVAGIGYMGAFVPPRWLRTEGQRAAAFDLARNLVTTRSGTGPDVLWRNLATSAREILGVRHVTIADSAGAVAADASGTGDARRDQDTADTRASVPIISDGKLRATLTAQLDGRPLFIEDDLEVVSLLGLMTVRAVEREEAIVRLGEARRQLEAAAVARASEARFRALLEAHPNAVMAVDEDGQIIWTTGPTTELFGGSAEALVGRALSELVQLDTVLLADTDRAVGAPSRLEATGYRLDGTAFPADVALTAFELDGRKHEIVVVSDASWRHEASLLRDRFLGILSHELRTPITAIYGGTQLLLKRGKRMTADDRSELLAGIASESERLQRIIANLLVLARVERGAEFFEPRPVAVKPVMRDVVERERPLWPAMTINLSIDDALPLVAADEEYLALIMRNLLSNAAKYAGEGAAVDVVVTHAGGEVVFRVIDNGPGINPEEAEKLFSLYFRSPAMHTAQGAGIGLFVCKGLVGAMNGRIWAMRREEGGAEFGFALRRWVEEGEEEDEGVEGEPQRPSILAQPAGPAT